MQVRVLERLENESKDAFRNDVLQFRDILRCRVNTQNTSFFEIASFVAAASSPLLKRECAVV